MIRKLLIRDLTLRDGQQSAFATRMSQAQIGRLLCHGSMGWGGSRFRDALFR